MPVAIIPAQSTASHSGAVSTSSGRIARPGGGAEFQGWVAKAASDQRAVPVEEGSDIADVGGPGQNESPPHAAALPDDVGESVAVGAEPRPEGNDEDIETQATPLPTMEVPTALAGQMWGPAIRVAQYAMPGDDSPGEPTSELSEREAIEPLLSHDRSFADTTVGREVAAATRQLGASPVGGQSHADEGQASIQVAVADKASDGLPVGKAAEGTNSPESPAPREAPAPASQAFRAVQMPDSEAIATPATTLLAREAAPPNTDQPLAFRLPPPTEPHRQIADAIVRTTSGQVEVVLDPIELGRVTVLLGEDGNPGRLALIVERPETLDLIRRHSDQLLRDLRDSGMPDARLEDLRQDDSANRRGGSRQTSGQLDAAEDSGRQNPDRTQPIARPAKLGRIDIRF